jgi:hypothetical protein
VESSSGTATPQLVHLEAKVGGMILAAPGARLHWSRALMTVSLVQLVTNTISA